jgi:hypothetical protein
MKLINNEGGWIEDKDKYKKTKLDEENLPIVANSKI